MLKIRCGCGRIVKQGNDVMMGSDRLLFYKSINHAGVKKNNRYIKKKNKIQNYERKIDPIDQTRFTMKNKPPVIMK